MGVHLFTMAAVVVASVFWAAVLAEPVGLPAKHFVNPEVVVVAAGHLDRPALVLIKVVAAVLMVAVAAALNAVLVLLMVDAGQAAQFA